VCVVVFKGELLTSTYGFFKSRPMCFFNCTCVLYYLLQSQYTTVSLFFLVVQLSFNGQRERLDRKVYL